ncbi:MAG: leucine-rich repeat protein [Bacteroidales bacterium]|nr:leucine-rich repeat protein [Bacteroidales bacterium]
MRYAVVEEGVTFIPESSFSGCYKLVAVSLPQSMRSIGRLTFSTDSNLRHVGFTDYIDTINYKAFYKTGLYDTLKLPKHLSFFGTGSFYATKITHVEVPYKVDTVGGLGATPLKSVVLPAGSSYLYGTFSNDSMLECIVDLSVRPQVLYAYSFGDPSDPITLAYVSRSKCRLVVPTSAVETYKNTPVWKDFLQIEGGGISVGVCFNDKRKGDVEGLENRFYKKGEKLTLVAYPRSGCSFTGWKTKDGKVISTSNALHVTVTQDTMLQACFDGEISVREPLKTASASVTLYPNPTGDLFTVRSESTVEEIVVSDLSGRVLLRTERTSHADVSALPQGLYLVRVRTEKGSCVKKLVRR